MIKYLINRVRTQFENATKENKMLQCENKTKEIKLV